MKGGRARSEAKLCTDAHVVALLCTSPVWFSYKNYDDLQMKALKAYCIYVCKNRTPKIINKVGESYTGVNSDRSFSATININIFFCRTINIVSGGINDHNFSLCPPAVCHVAYSSADLLQVFCHTGVRQPWAGDEKRCVHLTTVSCSGSGRTRTEQFSVSCVRKSWEKVRSVWNERQNFIWGSDFFRPFKFGDWIKPA